MPKKTLLEITQDILNDLDSDEANSINDTVEASQVARIIKSCYEEIISNRNWPHLKQLLQLEGVGTTYPNYLKLPEGVKELINLKYNVIKVDETRVQYRDIKYLEPDIFLDKIFQRNSDLSNIIQVQDLSGIVLLVQNDKAPEYWTSFDDEYIICDSYDSAVDDSLKGSKTQAMVYKEAAWTHDDDFIPDLPEEAFALLTEEAKSTAFLVLKQMANQKAEQKAGRQQRWLSRKAWRAHGGIKYPDFGR